MDISELYDEHTKFSSVELVNNKIAEALETAVHGDIALHVMYTILMFNAQQVLDKMIQVAALEGKRNG